MTDERFDEWAIVEMFGHKKLAGRVCEEAVGGCSFVRVDVPAVGGRAGFSKLLGQGSIYAITITDEKTALRIAEGLHAAPLEPWSIADILERTRALPESTDPDDF